MRAQIDARKGHQRCQPEEATRTAGIFSCQQQRAGECRGAVARWKGIAARFPAHDDCLDQGEKGPAAAEPLFDRMLNSRGGQPQGRHHGSRCFPAALRASRALSCALALSDFSVRSCESGMCSPLPPSLGHGMFRRKDPQSARQGAQLDRHFTKRPAVDMHRNDVRRREFAYRPIARGRCSARSAPNHLHRIGQGHNSKRQQNQKDSCHVVDARVGADGNVWHTCYFARHLARGCPSFNNPAYRASPDVTTFVSP
jgi:hypothetical protein